MVLSAVLSSVDSKDSTLSGFFWFVAVIASERSPSDLLKYPSRASLIGSSELEMLVGVVPLTLGRL